MERKAPRIGHKKSRTGCAQCKRRHVKCNEEAPCANCMRHGVACSLAGGPNVPREDSSRRALSATPSSGTSVPASFDLAGPSTLTPNPAHSYLPSSDSFTVLTGLTHRPGLGHSQGWQLDLQLMHHYMTHTNQIITEHQDDDSIRLIWQEQLPKVAFAFDYLMHALLGCSALHKAYLEPDLAPLLRARAVDHLDQALVLYRQDTEMASDKNASARFLFTWLVALFAFANTPVVAATDAIAEVILLVKGIDTMVADTWYWISQSDFAPLLGQLQRTNVQRPREPGRHDVVDSVIRNLDFMLKLQPLSAEDARVCALVVADLKQTSALGPSDRMASGMALIAHFPRHEAAAFSNLIKQRLPQALVILAHYCVLLEQMDARWWIHGWARRVMRDIQTSLDAAWAPWIDLPAQIVLKPPAPIAVSVI